MSETTFVLFHQAIAGIESILYAVALAMFFRSFMPGKQSARQLRKAALLIFMVYAAGYLLCMIPWFSGWMHMALVTGVLMLLSGFLGMERNFIFLLGILFHCIRSLCMMMVSSIDFFASEYFLRNADTPELIYRNAAFSFLFVEIVELLLFMLLLHMTGRRLKRGGMELHTRELCYLLLTPITGILFANIIVRLLMVAVENQIFRLYDQFPAFIGIIPAAAALFYAGILASITACQRIIALQEAKREYFVARQQFSAIQERIREVEQFHDGIRRMKHEMKNHLANIKGLAESGHYEDMETYISRMDDSMKVFELSIHTGNAVTDVIINDRQKAAAALGIDFQCSFSYPASDQYNAYDIGIILNNLLQNALDACAKVQNGPRYICITGRQKRKFFLIDVRNPFDGEITFDRNTSLPVSTKKRDGGEAFSSMHGIGLSNVKREAEKYMGDVDIQIENSEFHVTVLLQERRCKHVY